MKKNIKQFQIYATALKLFAKYGFKRTRVEDIANELNMTKGNIYLYTKDKKSLYQETVAYALQNWQELVKNEIQKAEDVVERFKIMSLKAYEYLSQMPYLCKILIDDPSIFPLSPKEDHFIEINKISINIIKSILSQGIKENRFRNVNVDVVAEVLFSVYIMFIIKTYIKPESGANMDMFKIGLDLILEGLIAKK
ncbi:MAG: TetR/AcrR family transcriptional regulator [Desulfobacterales bacterium]|nr:TetR/AcrR family transcriptional regulator [Desulfobacterales bacterium]